MYWVGAFTGGRNTPHMEEAGHSSLWCGAPNVASHRSGAIGVAIFLRIDREAGILKRAPESLGTLEVQ